MTVNLKEKPFYLEQEGINWVHDTIWGRVRKKNT